MNTVAARLAGFLIVVLLFFPENSLAIEAQRVRPVVPERRFTVTRAQSDYIRGRLKPGEVNELNAIGKTLAANPSFRAVEKRWGRLVESVARRGGPVDVQALVQWVLRESYLATNRMLIEYADKVKYYNDLKNKVRGELNRARSQVNGWRSTSTFSPNPPGPLARKGTVPRQITSNTELEDYLKRLEEELAALGDLGQLANFDLQTKMEQQQKALQAISNLAKKFHDTAMAIVRKIG